MRTNSPKTGRKLRTLSTRNHYKPGQTPVHMFCKRQRVCCSNKLSILNYNIEHVEKAVAVMEKHQGNTVGMTEEMHNCSADFSFVGPGDETSDVANPDGSHEVLNPLYKELTQLCDVAGKDKTAKTARDLETLIIVSLAVFAVLSLPATSHNLLAR
ncbi:hypothetical protein IV203_035919 [Nitzschia inconspicua]|uniref:Uncharacterized protein n=1 Tax=Nitzschia inconspicua TaxID=303405 RepID=A0A9K3PAP1_9STRA|nr:hypothetical protein IV203_006732 [Nitzschia inconspicua]KAG7360820.1 hypothetical protein IV203_035919 [Nitzschia inconspicua]